MKRDKDGLRLGVRISAAHCNARGSLHGGVIATLADNTMGLACAAAAGSGIGMVTVSLTTDYLAAAQLGQWLEVVGTPSQIGRTLCFATAIVTADGAVIARGSGVFRAISKGTG
ncbi:PaaI family thioesterase (plasmid) [Caulobacter sp. ErkDOM-YI]|uniref:PaaI family thioesterase n=1 Tax=unclassified Caulobacter TaxID=2648921 RepID=UPI003AF77A8E